MKKHEILKKYISGICKGYSNSLIVVSRAGYGKTETTLNTLEELGLEEEKHYLYISNYITPLEFYKLLQKVNELQDPKILVLDDIEETLKSPKIVGILKGALWPINNKRKVCWVSGTYKIQKQSFNFDGSIIFLLNEYKRKNALLNAVADRGFYYNFDLSLDELIQLMEKRAEIKEYQNIPYNKRKEIVKFIQEAGKSSPNMSLRLLPKAYNLYLLSPNHWRPLVQELL